MDLMMDYREFSRPLNNEKEFSENPESSCHAFAGGVNSHSKTIVVVTIVVVSEEGVDSFI